MQIKFKWERLDGDTFRAKVIGGWIVQSMDTGAMVFLSDPEHLWEA
jgi:hypothetical protein